MGEMSRRASCLSVVLVLLLSVQWVAAFGHCLSSLGLAPLAAGAGGHATEICTAEGLQTVLLGEDGQPAPPASQKHDSCPLCPGGAAPGPEAPSLPAVPILYITPAPPSVAGLPPAPARAPPQQPRAPPIA
jgi:hypothetical protein